jgi:hypothetical protein
MKTTINSGMGGWENEIMERRRRNEEGREKKEEQSGKSHSVHAQH